MFKVKIKKLGNVLLNVCPLFLHIHTLVIWYSHQMRSYLGVTAYYKDNVFLKLSCSFVDVVLHGKLWKKMGKSMNFDNW